MNDEQRQKFQGNWVCCDCGAAITELPFKPTNTDNLRCFECHKKNNPKQNRPERKMYDNDGQGWTCCECGGHIDQLPFEPRDPDTLKCRDCFKK